MKKVMQGIVLGTCLIGLVAAALYLGLSWYYRGEFSYNTWINGIYCTGKSVAEVNQELQRELSYEGLTIYDREGKPHLIAAGDINYTYDFTESLELYKARQNPYLWIDNLFRESRDKELLPVIHYDELALEREIKNLPFIKEALARTARKVEICKTGQGYVLVNERADVLDTDKAWTLIYDALNQFLTRVDLQAEECFEDLPLSEKMKEDLALWPKIQAFQDCGLVYKMGGDLVPIDAAVVCEWLALEEDGSFALDSKGAPVLDEEQVALFIDDLAGEYDTLGAERLFQATRGETVTVKGGIYGNRLEREAETEYLIRAFNEGRAEIHVPKYSQMALYQGKEDIGDTYIEIDLTQQMMYYYVRGECVITTPVVTGNTSLRRGTPEGVNYVYAKERNRILRGEDYASPVKYWMPVNGGIGIHDASWRSTYGGDIYKRNGSHGCINTPLAVVTEMYEMIEIGTPCVMFY